MRKWLFISTLLLLAGLFLFPDVSLAQDEDPSTLVFTEADPNDRTVKWLSALFPELSDVEETEAPVNVIAKLMKILSLTLLSLGLMWAGASTVGKLLQSNFDGKTLAQARGQTMTVIRLLGAVTALFPLPSGFPLISYLIFTVAIWGVNLGNALWSQTVDALVQEGNAVVQPAPSDIEGLARGLMAAETCMAALNAIGRENGVILASSGSPVELVVRNKIELPNQSVVSPSSDLFDRRFGLSYDGTPESSLGPGICGEFTATLPQVSSELPSLNPRPSHILDYQLVHTELLANAITPLAIGFANTQLDSDQALSIVDELRRDMVLLHDRVVDVIRSYKDGHNDFVSGFETDIGDNITEEAESLGERMKENGWSSAGAWWLQIVQINNQTQQYIDTLPQQTNSVAHFGGGDLIALTTLLGEDGARRAAQALLITEKFRNEVLLSDMEDKGVFLISGFKDNLDKAATGIKAGGGGSASILIAEAAQVIGGQVITLLSEFQQVIGEDPISAVIGFGQNLVTTSYASYLKLEEFAKEQKDKDSDFNAGSTMTSIQLLTLLPLLLAGAFLAFAMPIQLFIHFSLAVIGWFIAAIEAIIAGPIWALMHMRVQGHQMIPFQTKAGYKLVLSLFLRPAFMIIGFVVGIGVFYIAMAFVGEQFLEGLNNIYPKITEPANTNAKQNYSFFSLISIVVFIILFLTFAMAVIKLSIRLMTALPDEIMSRWVGVSSTSPLVDGAKNEVDAGAQRSKGAGGGIAKAAMQQQRQSEKPTSGGIGGGGPGNKIARS